MNTNPQMFLISDNCKDDPIVAAAMASYAKRLQREEDYRNAVRSGLIDHQPTQVWNISDRH